MSDKQMSSTFWTVAVAPDEIKSPSDPQTDKIDFSSVGQRGESSMWESEYLQKKLS